MGQDVSVCLTLVNKLGSTFDTLKLVLAKVGMPAMVVAVLLALEGGTAHVTYVVSLVRVRENVDVQHVLSVEHFAAHFTLEFRVPVVLHFHVANKGTGVDRFEVAFFT